MCLMYEAGHPKPVLCDKLEGWGGERSGGVFRMEGPEVYLCPIHVDV